MGTTNQSILYGALVLSCLLLPKLMIRLLKHKRVMGFAFIGYILWMGANGVGVWGTMVPASVIVGIVAAPLWTAQCSYFTKVAGKYCKLVNCTEEAAVSVFFGIFFCFFQTASILGSIISSTVLRPRTEGGDKPPTPEALAYCGYRDCPYQQGNVTNPNLEKPKSSVIWTMVGIYMGVAFCAVIIILSPLVDPLQRELEDEKKPLKEEAFSLFIGTVRHLKHKKQLLLIPITMYSGLEQAFFSAEWNNSFITCTIGIWKVGLATLPFGVVNAICSFSSGRLVKYIGRWPFFLIGFLIDFGILIALTRWRPDPGKEYLFYIISGLWGLTDGIWQTQINALYGCAFKDSEAAFSNYRMWESLGSIIAFAYSKYICTNAKIYVQISVLCVGIIGYSIVEIMLYKNKRLTKTTTVEPDQNED
ncbi:DgyrCDS3850 [Dimorphilus gyrociliatus]|uniref:DgyrCDS3850 n=1 Tax=Dimorphilus gyrociliatus TaxID=2664684 RepID=A0A7I8VHR5_9ANNE|nr:DgyrCDS3850 [Dimorphilus gyrociliatus]